MGPVPLAFEAGAADAGRRLDLALAGRFPGLPRAEIQRWIRAGRASVNGRGAKPSARLARGDRVEARPPAPAPAPPRAAPAIPILFEDACLVAVAKPAGLLTHAPRGSRRDSVVARLLAAGVPLAAGPEGGRPGVVHRLDRDTSGVLLLAKDPQARGALAAAFARREIRKEYRAIVEGSPETDADVIRRPIGRLRGRMRMAVSASGREAETAFAVLERFRGFSHLSVRPRTGRTHQIRVHLAFLGCPILCDPKYGRRRVFGGEELGLPAEGILLARHALHAATLALRHPRSGEPLEIAAPLPDDLEGVLGALRKSSRKGGAGT